jgi:hypothetical protein
VRTGLEARGGVRGRLRKSTVALTSVGRARRGSEGVIMKLAWLAAFGLLVSSAPALAQSAPPPAPAAQEAVDPERLALAREMTQVFDIKSAMHNMFGGMANAMKLPESATPEQRERVRQLYVSLGAGMETVSPDLMDKVATLYARTFTAQEMRDALTFYRSASGQAMLSKLPAVMGEVGPLMIGLMPKVVAAAKADYCRHRTCDQTDETMFTAMGRAYARPAS